MEGEEEDESEEMEKVRSRTSRMDSELLPEEIEEPSRPKLNLLGYPGDYPSNIADVRGNILNHLISNNDPPNPKKLQIIP